MNNQTPTVKDSYVLSSQLEKLRSRAMRYLTAGFPLHLCGPSGIGKTALAFHLAQCLNRPVTVIYGNEEFGNAEFLGSFSGLRRKLVLDNYIQSVSKRDESLEQKWVDGKIITACQQGHVLVYDEFNRSRPETNNILLSVLEEKTVQLPAGPNVKQVQVHPNFAAIFTSNPEEYAGVHPTQDALQTRMITIHLNDIERDTEVSITASRSGLSSKDAVKIVDLVAAFRRRTDTETGGLRSSIMIAKTAAANNIPIRSSDPAFREICTDVLLGKTQGDRNFLIKLNEVLSS